MQRFAAIFLVLAALATPAWSQHGGAGRPIRIVVPFSAGSASDTVARILADELRDTFGTLIVDNRPGANGIIGASHVAKAAPDGGTLVLTSSSTHSGIGALYKQPGYDPIADFVHIARIATIPMVLVTRPGAPFKTAKELAAQARKGRLRYGYGSGSAQIAGATFSAIADAPSDAIPYKSQPPAVTDLLGGQIDYLLADTSVVTTFLQGGRLGGLAITGPTRSAQLPAVPTMAEAGNKDFDLVVWVGLAAPAKTPPAVVAAWNQAIRRALDRPAVVAKLARLGMVASPNTMAEHQAFTVAQRDIWVSRATKAGVEQQ